MVSLFSFVSGKTNIFLFDSIFVTNIVMAMSLVLVACLTDTVDIVNDWEDDCDLPAAFFLLIFFL